jgi:hypothetical protein
MSLTEETHFNRSVCDTVRVDVVLKLLEHESGFISKPGNINDCNCKKFTTEVKR